MNLRYLKWICGLGIAHLVLTGTAILGAFGAGMVRFDSPDVQAGIPERVFGALATVLPQPALGLVEWSGARGMSPFLQWVILGANSLLWAAVSAWVVCFLIQPKPR